MKQEQILEVYRAYSPSYDLIFGLPLRTGRRWAVQALELRPGQRALEAGFGTGLSLPYYPDGVELHGLDLSEPMLAKARARQPLRLDLVLQLGDAQATAYPDGYFDGVCAVYVASVTPDPAALITELLRVCKPGGKVVLVNHWASPHGWRRKVEAALRPFASRLGFEPALELEPLLQKLGLRPERRSPVGPLGLFTLLRFIK